MEKKKTLFRANLFMFRKESLLTYTNLHKLIFGYCHFVSYERRFEFCDECEFMKYKI